MPVTQNYAWSSPARVSLGRGAEMQIPANAKQKGTSLAVDELTALGAFGMAHKLLWLGTNDRVSC
jgi:hypothetical protein